MNDIYLEPRVNGRLGKRRKLRQSILALALAFASGTAGAAMDSDVQAQLNQIEATMDQIEFHLDRINNPPDHAVARSIASLSVCGSLTASNSNPLSASLKLGAKGEGRVDPSFVAAGIVEGRASVNASLNGSIGIPLLPDALLKMCVDVMPWLQLAYYEALNQDPEKEFYGQSSTGFGDWISNSEAWTGLTDDAKDFLRSVGALTMDRGASIPDSPFIGQNIQMAADLFGSGSGDLFSNIEDLGQRLTDPGGLVESPLTMTTDQKMFTYLEKTMPFFPPLSDVANKLLEVQSPADLNPCPLLSNTLFSYSAFSTFQEACDIPVNELSSAALADAAGLLDDVGNMGNTLESAYKDVLFTTGYLGGLPWGNNDLEPSMKPTMEKVEDGVVTSKNRLRSLYKTFAPIDIFEISLSDFWNDWMN